MMCQVFAYLFLFSHFIYWSKITIRALQDHFVIKDRDWVSTEISLVCGMGLKLENIQSRV